MALRRCQFNFCIGEVDFSLRHIGFRLLHLSEDGSELFVDSLNFALKRLHLCLALIPSRHGVSTFVGRSLYGRHGQDGQEN